MAIPVIELFFLRFFLHSFLELRIGFPGFTDYELLLPAPFGFLAFLLALEQEEKVGIKLQPCYVLINLFLLIQFVFVNYFYSSSQFTFGALFPFLWWGNLVLLITTAFFVWTKPSAIFGNKNFWSILPSLIMVFSLVAYFNWGQQIWGYAINKLGWVLKEVLSFTGAEAIKVHAGRRFLQIQHPLLVVHLGQGCGGWDGLLFFLSSFSIFATLKWKAVSRNWWLLAIFCGCLFFSILNVLRILVLFWLGLASIHLFGSKTGLKLNMDIFHVHSGYIIYAVGLYAYYGVLERLRKVFSFRPPASKPEIKKTKIRIGRLPEGVSGIPEQSIPT
jgi:exosortase/archaeosortase family protein